MFLCGCIIMLCVSICECAGGIEKQIFLFCYGFVEGQISNVGERY